jgi:Tol biopolymer transport system component
VGSGPGAGASTSALPQNGLIAVEGAHGIYLVDPLTKTAKLVPKSEWLSDPAWSPDGTTLAVAFARADSYDVYTMKPDGSERTLVLRDAYSPSWSPDGKQLVVVRRPCGTTTSTIPCGETNLVIVNADGTDMRGLGSESRDAFTAQWSPDGKLIAYVEFLTNNLKLITPDGERVQMPTIPVSSMSVSWSPDSSKLAYDRYDAKSGGSIAVVLDRASGKETVLRGEQSGAEAPVWSPEGDQIAYFSMRLRATQPSTTGHSCGGEPYEKHLWSMRPDGTKAQRLVKGEFYGQPSWGRAVEVVSAPAPVVEQQPVSTPIAEP